MQMTLKFTEPNSKWNKESSKSVIDHNLKFITLFFVLSMQILLQKNAESPSDPGLEWFPAIDSLYTEMHLENTTINLQKCIERQGGKKSCFLCLHGFQSNSRLFHTLANNMQFQDFQKLNFSISGFERLNGLFEDQWICYWLVLVFKANFHGSLK